MSAAAEKVATAKVGDMVEADQVVRPDGMPHTITDRLYVLDVPGVHVLDGVGVDVK